MKKSPAPQPKVTKKLKAATSSPATVPDGEQLVADSIRMLSDNLGQLTRLVDDLAARVDRHADHIIMVEQALEEVMALTGSKSAVRARLTRRSSLK